MTAPHVTRSSASTARARISPSGATSPARTISSGYPRNRCDDLAKSHRLVTHRRGAGTPPAACRAVWLGVGEDVEPAVLAGAAAWTSATPLGEDHSGRAEDPDALRRTAIGRGVVAAAVRDAVDGEDAEGGVRTGEIGGEGRGRRLDAYAVGARPPDDVALHDGADNRAGVLVTDGDAEA